MKAGDTLIAIPIKPFTNPKLETPIDVVVTKVGRKWVTLRVEDFFVRAEKSSTFPIRTQFPYDYFIFDSKECLTSYCLE